MLHGDLCIMPEGPDINLKVWLEIRTSAGNGTLAQLLFAVLIASCASGNRTHHDYHSHSWLTF